jgi:hypothetical protein
VVLDFVVGGPWFATWADDSGQRVGGPRWWWPVTWLALPLGYLTWYVYGDLDVYSFLDPHDPGYSGVVAAFLGATLALAYVLYAARKAVENTLVSRASPA